MRLSILVSVLFLSTWRTAISQTSGQDEPAFTRLTDAVKSEEFSVGVVVQAVGDLIWDREGLPGNNGFSISTARLSVQGDLDFGLGYFLQTDFSSSPALLDARLSYRIAEHLSLNAGLFKAPFSAEFLIPAPSIDFVNRSQSVSVLAPGRQLGVALRGGTADEMFGYNVGVFNGNGRSLQGNDNGRLMYVGRVFTRPSMSEGSLEVGVNIAFSEDDFGGTPADRLLFGGDFRWMRDRVFVSGEAIYADLDPVVGDSRQPFGYQATLGYMLSPARHQILARWDALDLDTPAGHSNFIVLGYNFWPSQAFEVQVNYLIPTHEGSDFADQQVLVNFQVAF
jgi:hypothetical protein